MASIESIYEHHSSLSFKYNGNEYSVSIGDRFGMLTITDVVKYREGKISRKGCIALCDCGNQVGPSRLISLVDGDLISCGCYCRKVHSDQMTVRNTIHGDSKRAGRSKLYILWAAMKDRATNPNRPDAKYYNLKGIELYTDWYDYDIFKQWAINNGYEEGLSIERKNINDGYNPDNCIFIPVKDQNLNKSTSRLLTVNGVTKNMSVWCRELGLEWSTVDRRLKRGLSDGQALGLE